MSATLQVVFLGLEMLLPLMSLELLKFPKLSCLYFQLLAHMLEVSTWAAALAAFDPCQVVEIC